MNNLIVRIKEGATVIIAIISLVSIIFGAYFYNENRYAHAKELKETREYTQKIEKRLDYKILTDSLKATRDRLWYLEVKYGKDINKIKDNDIRKEIMELKEEQELLKEQLKSIMREVK